MHDATDRPADCIRTPPAIGANDPPHRRLRPAVSRQGSRDVLLRIVCLSPLGGAGRCRYRHGIRSKHGAARCVPPRTSSVRHLADDKHRLRSRAHFESAKHRRDMVLDRFDGKIQRPSDQLVGLAPQQQRQHLRLTSSQAESSDDGVGVLAAERCRAPASAFVPPVARILVRRCRASHDRRRQIDPTGDDHLQRLLQRVVAEHLQTKPIAPRSMARSTCARRSDADTITIGTAG